ncbi:LOG family protein [Taibaiella helva]|uniref:LOG family protein n=1 Tax=Taibaiella helva TaxID=2301235 RepID=UPI000E568294|nr:TIGR00730 family Rossman fold protein [Taibaiella helva]
MKSITVFCASSPGFDAIYHTTAFALGQLLAEKGITVVYGGARVGLMGAVANGALHGSGKVIGVLPHFLRTKEIAHNELTEMILVESMHERKTKMNELCDGVIALPGGFGTMEELFEMLTWAQLGLHRKPIGLLNINGFYDSLLALLEHMTESGLLKETNRRMLLVSDKAEDLLQQMANYKAPEVGKWLSEETT